MYWGKASGTAYHIVGKLNTCYSPDDKTKEFYKNLDVGLKQIMLNLEIMMMKILKNSWLLSFICLLLHI